MHDDIKVKTELYDEHVGQKLRQARKMAGFSQTALGERVGLTFQQVQKHENGTVRISSGRLLAYAIALSMPIKFFYDGIEPEALSNDLLDSCYLNLTELSELKSSCIKLIAEAEEKDIDRLVDFLEHFISKQSLEEA